MVFQGQAANHKKNKKTQIQNTKQTQTKHKIIILDFQSLPAK